MNQLRRGAQVEMILTPDNARIMHSFKCILAGHYLSAVSPSARPFGRVLQRQNLRPRRFPPLLSSPLLTFIKTLKFLEQLRRTLDNPARRCEIAAGNGPIYVASIFPPQKRKRKGKNRSTLPPDSSLPLLEKNFCVFWQATRLLTKKSQYIHAIHTNTSGFNCIRKSVALPTYSHFILLFTSV